MPTRCSHIAQRPRYLLSSGKLDAPHNSMTEPGNEKTAHAANRLLRTASLYQPKNEPKLATSLAKATQQRHHHQPKPVTPVPTCKRLPDQTSLTGIRAQSCGLRETLSVIAYLCPTCSTTVFNSSALPNRATTYSSKNSKDRQTSSTTQSQRRSMLVAINQTSTKVTQLP